jgi:hypothetical protein
MEGGIAIFLLFVIIVVGLVLAFVLGGIGGGTEALRAKRAGRGRGRPQHTVVEDDGSDAGRPGDHLPNSS